MNTAFAKDPGGVEAQVPADRLDKQIRTLTETSERRRGPFRVIGQSPEWRQVLRKAARVAVTESAVQLGRKGAPYRPKPGRADPRGSGRCPFSGEL